MQCDPPRRFLILGNGQKKAVAEAAVRITEQLQRLGGEVVLTDLAGVNRMPEHNAEIAVVLGGDGAILRAAHRMADHQIPVLGVNLGRLGFLAELSPEDLENSLGEFFAGRFEITRHLMLESRWTSPDDTASDLVLNEILISAGPPFAIIDVEMEIDGQPVATFSGDGLIVSTPIGSTAHNLAAGGPILRQTLPAIAITPVCPHALTWRPLVESADRRLTLRCTNPTEGTTLIVDGIIQRRLSPQDRIELSRRRDEFSLVHLAGRTYYQTLTEKLDWGRHPARRPPLKG